MSVDEIRAVLLHTKRRKNLASLYGHVTYTQLYILRSPILRVYFLCPNAVWNTAALRHCKTGKALM